MSYRSIVYCLTLCLLTGCMSMADFDTRQTDTDWTIFRGSPSLSGCVDHSLPSKPVLEWMYDNDLRTVASPIICGGNAYTLDRKGVMRGIDSAGREFFRHDFQTTVEASFIIADSVAYVGCIDGYVRAFSLADKRVVWEYETLGQISASPNIVRREADDLLLIGSYDNNMYTFSTTSGEKVNEFETGYYINGAAAVWKNYMVFGGCDGLLRIVNTSTGQQTDSMTLKAYIPASPAVSGDYAYVSDYNGDLYEVELKDGRFGKTRLLITVDTDSGETGVTSTPTVSTTSVFVMTGDRHVRCIDRKTGRERWSKLLRGDTGDSAPLVCQGKLLVCTKDGHVSILDADDGSELWHYEIGEQIIASPAVLSNCFYIQTSRGKLFKFK